jgi:hypothetical protein
MSKIAEARFSGKYGGYDFEVYSLDTTFNPVGAVYIFSKRTADPSGKGTHDFIYIGQTDSLASRIPSHEKWPCINRNGANCICVHRDDNEQSRLDKETDLRAQNRTPCNDQ